MIVGTGNRVVHHSVREDFGHLLRAALMGTDVHVAHGPIYGDDPAAELLAPFVRSAREVGMDPDLLAPSELAPRLMLEKACLLRQKAVSDWEGSWRDVVDWTRAGLVLEVASRRGIPFRDGTKAHVKWKLRGTVTGRFGVDGGFNPLVIPKDHRSRIVPSGPGRDIVVIDFRAMDLCSMISVVPGLSVKYLGAPDPHARTAELVGLDRSVAKKELFVHAYGGNSPFAGHFHARLPELDWLRSKPHGEGARLVQTTSATAFKAGLSLALPSLVKDKVCPLFTVHDELTLDASEFACFEVEDVVRALELGASERIGVPYTVGVTFGRNYAEAKGS